MMKCFDKRILIGLGALVLAVWLLAPQWAGIALVAAAALFCPMSMLLMMRPSSSTQCAANQPGQDPSSADRSAELARLRQEIDARTQTTREAGEPPGAPKERSRRVADKG